MVVVDYFEKLTAEHITYDAVKNFMTSNLIRVIEPGDYDGRYAIFRYVKGETDMSLSNIKFLRSVVWDRTTNSPVCVAPFKSENMSLPTDKTIFVEDYIDGVMVNVFIGSDGKPILVTRSFMDATGTFYNKTSFQKMFLDALTESGGTLTDLGNEIIGAGYSFASFVLQHPEHRIVARIRKPRMYLVSLGKMNGASITLKDHDFEILPSMHVHKYAPQPFIEGAAYTMVTQLSDLRGWTWQGLVFKDDEGHRWRIRSHTYHILRNLRGSEATATERFLRLRKENKIKDYLQHYSEDRNIFWQIEQTLRSQTSNIFNAYRCVHKEHKMKFSDLPKEYQTPVFRLHAKYLASKKTETTCKIEMKDVIDFINNLLPYEQVRILSAPALPAV